MKASVLKSIIYWLINLEIHIMILVLASKVIGECHKMVKEQECIVAPNAFCVNMSQWFSKKTSLYKNTYASPICSPISVGTLVTLVGFANQLCFSNLKNQLVKQCYLSMSIKLKCLSFYFKGILRSIPLLVWNEKLRKISLAWWRQLKALTP